MLVGEDHSGDDSDGDGDDHDSDGDVGDDSDTGDDGDDSDDDYSRDISLAFCCLATSITDSTYPALPTHCDQ